MPQNNTNEVRATAKYVRVAPRKARAVVSLIRNLPVEKALEVLQFSTRAASVDVAKVLGQGPALRDRQRREQQRHARREPLRQACLR